MKILKWMGIKPLAGWVLNGNWRDVHRWAREGLVGD